jgi:hypothetical protein
VDFFPGINIPFGPKNHLVPAAFVPHIRHATMVHPRGEKENAGNAAELERVAPDFEHIQFDRIMIDAREKLGGRFHELRRGLNIASCVAIQLVRHQLTKLLRFDGQNMPRQLERILVVIRFIR